MTSDAKNSGETVITADVDVPIVRIVRAFEALPDQVFRAHADPDLFAQWFGPSKHEMRIDYFDCRVGGSYRYLLGSDGQEFGFHGCFHDVRPGELIVQTTTFEGQPDGVALERLVFEDVGGGRTLLTSTSLVDSFAERDAWLSSGMQEGTIETYRRLDALLAR